MKRFFTLIWILSFAFSARNVYADLTKKQDLSFGTVAPLATSGNATVIVSTAGAATFTGSKAIGAAYRQGIVNFSQAAVTLAVLMSFSVTPATLTLSNGSNTVTASNFTVNPSSYTLLIALLTNIDISIGATLTFPYNAPRGTYTGTATLRATGLLAEQTATFNVTVTLLQPIIISAIQQMQFGILTSGASATTVRLSTAGARSIVSGSTSLMGTAKAGQFSVTGEPNQTVTVTLPSTVTLTSGANTMTVSNLTSSPTPTFNASGQLTLSVGGDLALAANQKSGVYTGSYVITVNY